MIFWHFLTILSSFGAHTGGSHMDQNLLSLYIVQLASIDKQALAQLNRAIIWRDIQVFDIFQQF